MSNVENKVGAITLEQVAEVVAKRFKLKIERIVEEATLEELGFDSLSQVDLALLLEKKLDIKIPDAELAKINSIGDILQFANAELV
ncbi:acyl carrier protein [Mitsuaria sp. WAJ17]|uniref:acyl carrier protein n=1 Tax=Mitsuaria sp. WAJ17 TaxID=2761452 RepID=UPI001602F3CB|nr:acyl carrier protein [Mitsuaria sp. WAJ17]MBB2485697.1 acyl carrier protein [Mitsuaria sp. WAJ17]